MSACGLGKKNMSDQVIRIALLGAESTGKTSLSIGIANALHAMGLRAVTVPEVLREWCDAHGRTPRQDEQASIAQQQADQTFSIASGWVIADTSPLMTAVYSDFIFKDQSLYASALAQQAQFDVTLLMGLDIAWTPDGLQRDGAHVREPVDALLRDALNSAGIAYKVIYGQSEARLAAALLAIQESVAQVGTPLGAHMAAFKTVQTQRDEGQYGLNRGKTAWRCDLCSDADCEHKLFSALLKSDGSVDGLVDGSVN
jgi:nicotinamide riboside kinase